MKFHCRASRATGAPVSDPASRNANPDSRRVGDRRSVPAAGRNARAFTIIETLIYFSVLAVLLAVGYCALYRCMDRSTALRRSADDIANAVRAGENWRADLRAARGPVKLEADGAEEILRLPGARGEISYRFATNTVFRRVGNNGWTKMLDNVQASSFTLDRRQDVTAWRWELELQTRAKRLSRIKPLFTFIAVPGGEASP